MRIQKSHLFLLCLLLISSIVLFNFYQKVPKLENEITKNLKEDAIRSVSSMVKNFQRHIETKISLEPRTSLELFLRNNNLLREQLESELNILITKDVKYAFMLYRDKKGKLRFLLDGSAEDKVPIGRKFDTQSDIWEKAYQTHSTQTIEDYQYGELWVTHIHPIVLNGKVEGIVGIDLSLEGHEKQLEVIEPLKKMLVLVFTLIIVVVAVILFQYFLYYFTNRRVYLDALTGIKNRQYLNDVLETINFQKYHIAMIDIDHFKNINDVYGHNIGDRVLKTVAQTLDNSIRNEDIIIRYGGEEFLLLVSSRDLDTNSAYLLSERLRLTVEKLQINIENVVIPVRISIGLNVKTPQCKNMYEAIKLADENLYEAKRNGRNCTISNIFPQSTSENKDKDLNVHEVKEAIEENRLFFEYQPIVDMHNSSIIKHEVLMRLKNRNGDIIYPGSFLPNIKKSQVYKELTLKLIQINYYFALEHNLKLSININIMDILDDAIYKELISLCSNDSSLQNILTLEVLEEEKIENLELLVERLNSLHNYGVLLAIDDFGTGYSNFSHILQLDIDIIKIDGSLVENIHKSDLSLQLVKAIIAFAKSTNKTIIAEFIHNKEVMDIIKDLGVQYGQGFYLGKPSYKPIEKLSFNT